MKQTDGRPRPSPVSAWLQPRPEDPVPTPPAFVLGAVVTLLAATVVDATDQRPAASASTIVRVSSATPGREVRVHGVVLVHGRPMQVLERATPFELRSDRELVFAAFEPSGSDALLRLELSSDTPEPAVITAPRVMVGRQIGGVATEFVQGY
jgi:hypothetical protein